MRILRLQQYSYDNTKKLLNTKYVNQSHHAQMYTRTHSCTHSCTLARTHAQQVHLEAALALLLAVDTQCRERLG